MLGNNVLVAEVEKENKSAGGIILSGETSKAFKPGLVLAIGDTVDGIHVKNRVYLDWGKSMPVDFDGKAAVIISKEFIKAVIE